MKKIGIIIFIAALIIGVTLANAFAFGKTSANFFSFNFKFGRGVKGSGNIANEKRDISNFKGIDVGGVYEVEIVAQKDFSVEVEADDNLLPFIKTEVDNGILEISAEKRFNTKNPIRIKISAPNIEELEISGASKINLSGLDNNSLKVDSSGASKIEISGKTVNLNIESSGASKIGAENLQSQNVDIDASGASKIEVFVSGSLKVDASGASKITYAGNPQNIEKDTSGAGSVNGK